jgi:hypothetical protein
MWFSPGTATRFSGRCVILTGMTSSH